MIQHAYIGDEFCESKIPTLGCLKKQYRLVREAGLKLMLASPPSTGRGLARLERLFGFLSTLDDATEIVVNDYGVLRLMRKKYAMLRPVLGRLMNKMIRDPRITPSLNTPDAPPDALASLQQYGSLPFYKFLREWGVERVEVDNFHQGIKIDFKSLGIKPSIHIPYSVVATGRVCFFSSINKSKDTKFQCSTSCKRECDVYAMGMKNTSISLLQKGQTVFYYHGRDLLKQGLEWAKKNGALIIIKTSPFSTAYTTEDINTARSLLGGL